MKCSKNPFFGEIILDISGCNIVSLNNAKLSNVSDPEIPTDAATKKYVDDAVGTVTSVKTHTFTVSGPVAANGTFDLSFSGMADNPFSGNTIFFGQPISFLTVADIPFEAINREQSEAYDGTKYTYGGTFHMKALTAIPEGATVTILWVWM